MRRIIALTVILTVIIFPLVPVPVQAATETLTVNGAGTETDGVYSGGATNYTNLNIDDGDTTVAYMGNIGGAYQHSLNYSNTVASSGMAINSLTMYYKLRYEAAGGTRTVSPYVRLSGVKYYGTTSALTITYTQFSYTWSVNPATGVAWTSAQIDSAIFGVEVSIAAVNTYVDWTYTYVSVDYTIATAPSVTTVVAGSIGATSATFNGTLTSTGTANVDHEGFVWDVASKPAPGNVAPAASGYANNWTDNSTAFRPASFWKTKTVLAGATTHYFRAFAHNSVGWVYGSELSFSTLTIPTITTSAASAIATTTAQLNASVIGDGGQPCDVRFGYDTVTRANVAAYTNKTAWVNDLYSTGNSPYANIATLVAITTYYFRVEIRNDAGSSEGAELTFITDTGVSKPTNFITISSATTCSVSWTTGVGASRTLIRYSSTTYPATTTSGTLFYLGNSTSSQMTGLTPGKTYYLTAWGETGGLYSGGNAQSIFTTTALSGTTGSKVETPPANSSWLQTPDETKVQSIPFLPEAIAVNSDAFKVPENMLWYFLWILFSTGVGIILYNKGNFNLPMSVFISAACLGMGAAIGLTYLAILAIFAVIASGFMLFGERR